LNSLANKNILLGVTGGIAAYKSAEIVRFLKKIGSSVRVVMTKSAEEFITPLTLQALSGNKVSSELLDPETEAGMGHIELAKWADAILVAPATANTLAKLASGRGDDLLSSICLAFEGPISLAPAMNQAMWKDSRTEENINKLIDNKFNIYGPGSGEQACGDVGLGRMLEPEEIISSFSLLFEEGELINKNILITAGPTQEPIDPVRYITNRSSGKMGYSLAEAGLESGAKVTLISGPVNIEAPEGVHLVKVKTAEEMHMAVMHHVKDSDVFISSAAVADYKPQHYSKDKLKKSDKSTEISIGLTANQDILKSVSEITNKPYLVGFAAETSDLIKNAKIKLTNKGLDLIIANDVSNTEIGFDSEENEVMLINNDSEYLIKKEPKKKVASKIIKYISEQLLS